MAVQSYENISGSFEVKGVTGMLPRDLIKDPKTGEDLFSPLSNWYSKITLIDNDNMERVSLHLFLLEGQETWQQVIERNNGIIDRAIEQWQGYADCGHNVYAFAIDIFRVMRETKYTPEDFELLEKAIVRLNRENFTTSSTSSSPENLSTRELTSKRQSRSAPAKLEEEKQEIESAAVPEDKDYSDFIQQRSPLGLIKKAKEIIKRMKPEEGEVMQALINRYLSESNGHDFAAMRVQDLEVLLGQLQAEVDRYEREVDLDDPVSFEPLRIDALTLGCGDMINQDSYQSIMTRGNKCCPKCRAEIRSACVNRLANQVIQRARQLNDGLNKMLQQIRLS